MTSPVLKDLASRAGIHLRHRDYGYSEVKPVRRIRQELAEHVYGPGHPGFTGTASDIDAHLSLLLDATDGKYGRAVRIGLFAYQCRARALRTFSELTSKRRRDRKSEALASANIAQWTAVYRPARMTYLAARAVQKQADRGLLPAEHSCGLTEPWEIPMSLPVTTDAETLINASENAVYVGRHVLATAVRPEEIVVPGISFAREPTPSQLLMKEMEGFVTRLKVAACTHQAREQ